MRSNHARRPLALEASRFIKQGKEHTLDICRAIARCHQLVVNLDVKRLLTDLYLHPRLRLLAARLILRCTQ